MYVKERFSLMPLIRGAGESQNMVQRSTLLMIGLGFTLGLTVGLLLHLPGVSSPNHARGRRDVSRGDNEHTDAAPPVFSPTLEQRRQNDSENRKISQDSNHSGLKSLGQTGHVPKIPSNNIPSIRGHEAKPVPKQTSGQNHPTESVSVLQVRIRQTKDTIDNIKEQHGWNSSKSNGKQADKRPLSPVSHRDAVEKTPSTSSSRSKTRTVSISGDGKNLGSREASSLLNSHHSENKKNISLNPNNLNLQGGKLKTANDRISVSNERENDGLNVANGIRRENGKSDDTLSSNGQRDVTVKIMEQLPPKVSKNTFFNGIYWSPEAEMMVPESITEEETKAWRHKVNTQTVAAMKQGCGRQQNRLVQLSDGSIACARYRINRDQIQGEVFSYYLARLLGIQNVPPPVLALPDPSDPRWSPVLDELISAQWNSDRVVVLTPWVENLNPVFIPEELRPASRRLHPDPISTENRKPADIGELVQWSDLIILDYLTANVDRAVNNLYNLQWNSDMMSAPAHNLEKVGQHGPLIFLDNESGLFHSYRLLDKYSEYQESFLKALCVFRQSTADAIKTLAKEGQIGNKLAGIFTEQEPLHTHLPLPRATNMAILQTRLQNVAKQIEYCDKLYTSNQM